MSITNKASGTSRVSFVLICLGVYFLLAVTWQDVSLLQFDDATYLDSGRYVHASMFLSGLTTMPLYASWFRLLTYVCPDPLWRQFLSWGILTALAALLPVLFEVSLGWLYAGILFSVSFFQIQPYVSLFAAMFFVAGVCLLFNRRPSLAQSASAACAACFVVAYSRPEYQYGVFFSATAAILAFAAERKSTSRRGFLSAMGAVLLLAGAMFYVVKHSDSGRSGVAFAQHYNLKAAAKGLIPHATEWDSTYAYDVFGVNAAANGGAHSITEFFHANPRLFLLFVLSNVLSAMTLLLVAGLAGLVWWTWGRAENRWLRPASLFIVLMTLPTLLSMSLVYPDRHYLSIIFPALLLFGLQLLRPEQVAKLNRSMWIPIVLLVLTVAASLRKSMVVNGLMSRPNAGLKVVRCLRELDRQPVSGSLTEFDSTHTAGVYLLSSRKFVHPEDLPGWNDFNRWVVETRPDWIVARPGLEDRYGISHEQFLQLVAQKMGYSSHLCPGDVNVTVYAAPAR